jgi:hypothetical protein
VNRFIIAMTLALAVVCAGCASSGISLPKPETPKQAGVTALVAYGLAGSYAKKYTHYPECTDPLTAVPCKKADIAEKVKAADTAAYDAAIAADAAANDAGKQKDAADKLKALNAANAVAKQNGGK